MRHSHARWAAGALMAAALAGTDALAAGPSLDDRVAAAMQRGADYLLKKQRKDNWEHDEKWWDRSFKSGETSLVLYALLHVGQGIEDARLKPHSAELAPVVKWLCSQTPDTVYGAAFRANALSMAAHLKLPEVRRALEADKQYLMQAMRPDGGYTYSTLELRKYQQAATTNKAMREQDWAWDNSNAQYALLGMWAINDAGIETRVDYWRTADNYWRAKQQKDGGWVYDARWRPKSCPQMNLAGLASLYITGEFVGYKRRDAAMAAAWDAIARDYRANRDDYYTMYGLERVGLATGIKFIGTSDWYRDVATHIVERQQPDGSWQYREGERGDGGESQIVATSYALLFLARGRNPVIFNKLSYGGDEGSWDTNPRDNANVTAWMSKTFERPLNWQVVNLKVEPEQWLDAPILMISGGSDPKFSGEDVEKIKRFIDAGGMVLSISDVGDKGFGQAVTKSMAPAAVDKKYEMKELPKDHPIFTEKLWGKVVNPPKMMAMNNGVRDVWVHTDTDFGATWHFKRAAIKDHWTIAANLYFYAVGRGSVRNKLQPLTVEATDEKPRRRVVLARVDYGGNADPEPGAWPRMAKVARGQFHTELAIETSKAAALKNSNAQIAHLTGTTRFTLSPEDIDAMKAFVAHGGTLFADAAGGCVEGRGGVEFRTSLVESLKAAWPDASLVPIPLTDRLYDGSIAESAKITEATFRRGTPPGHGGKPRLSGIQKDGRWIVIFSEDDITSGLLGTDTWGISGYASKSAIDLARNVLLYVAK